MNRKIFTIINLIGLAALAAIMLLSSFTRAAVASPTAVNQSSAPTAVLANFDDGPPADWFEYNNVHFTATFPIISGTGVLSVTYNVPDWGGFGALLPEVDWSTYEAVVFDFYGRDSGVSYTFELQDGAGAVPERFHATFTDDFVGWRTLLLPFAQFERAGFQDPGAPDDGFQLDQILAWVFPLPIANSSFMMDNLNVVDVVPFADFNDGPPAGWYVYNGAGSTFEPQFPVVSDTDPYAMPGQIGDNGILSATHNTTDWGGFGALFGAGQDWQALQGVTFWVYGHNSGLTYSFELQDGTVGNGVVERFNITYTDNFTGWQLITRPFSSFVRSDYQEPGAPDDGLNLVDVRAWAFPLPVGNTPLVMDGFSVYGDSGDAELQVKFSQLAYSVQEGHTAVVTATLNMSSSWPVTVSYASSDGSGVAGVDYTAVSGTLVFPPDSLTQSFTVETLDNDVLDGARTVQLNLTDAVSATLGNPNQLFLTIIDDELPTPGNTLLHVVDDFELAQLVHGMDGSAEIGWVVWNAPAASAAITLTAVVSDGLPAPVPGLGLPNTVLQLDGSVNNGEWAGFTHAFENETVDQWLPQDWSGYEGVSFWLYGNNSGGTLFFDILDNRNPGSSSDDAERYSIELADDFAGWRYFELPFSAFSRKDIGNGAPSDGLTLTAVHGYGLGMLGSVPMLNQTYYLDQVALMVRSTVIDDYELPGLVHGMDGSAEIGWVVWSAPAASSAITLTAVVSDGLPAPVPGLGVPNTVMQLDATVASGEWAGYTHAFENETVDQWLPQDWSGYQGVAFWLYGQNSGHTLYIDILDNRNPGSSSDDAERYGYNITDNFAGWRYFAVPFTDFNRKEIGNGAPNDGFTLTEVHGYGIGVLGAGAFGPQTYYVDHVIVYGDAGPGSGLPGLSFELANFEAMEGDTAVIDVTLNQSSTETITVSYRSAESYARIDQDYTPVSGQLVFAPGETSQSFTISTYANEKYKGDQLLALVLEGVENAELVHPSRATLTILEADPLMANWLDDFEQFHRFYDSQQLSLGFTEILAGSPMARPGQAPFETVLTLAGEGSGPGMVSRTFAEPVDWSGHEALKFWVYGRGTGETIRLQLQDNRSNSTATTSPEDWALVWSDEFDGGAGVVPDRNVWKPEIGDGFINNLAGWGNGELQFYTDSPDNASLDGSGNLLLTAQQVNTSTSGLVCYYGPCEYTSARLITSDRFEIEYGRIEARVQLPTGQGIWPAFWALGNDIGTVGWPQSGELDIMENIGREPNIAHGTIHGPGYSGCCGIGGSYTLPSGNFYEDFHTFAVEWEPEEIRWYIDDVNFFTASIDDIPEGSDWVFDHPFFLIMNIAVGGNWPGYPDDTTVFPQTMAVDYVRVYQAVDTAERFEASFVDDFTGWREIVMPLSDFTRSADQPVGAPDDGLTLTEVWGYGFVFPEGLSQPLHVDRVRLASLFEGYWLYLPMILAP